MISLLSKCVDTITEDGLLVFILKVFKKCLKLIFRKPFHLEEYYIFKMDLSKLEPDKAFKIKKTTEIFKLDSPQQLDKYQKNGYNFSFCKDVNALKMRISDQLLMFFTLTDNTPSHISFVALSRKKSVDPFFKREPSIPSGFIGPCITNEKYRGLGLYPYALNEICRFLKEKGFSSAWISTAKNNNASINGIRKAGFQLVTNALWIRIAYIDLWIKNKDENYTG